MSKCKITTCQIFDTKEDNNCWQYADIFDCSRHDKQAALEKKIIDLTAEIAEKDEALDSIGKGIYHQKMCYQIARQVRDKYKKK